MIIENNKPLKDYSTFKVGGEAKTMIWPESILECVEIVKSLKKSKERFFVFGGGSNIVFSDNGFDGTVISIESLEKTRWNENDLHGRRFENLRKLLNEETSNPENDESNTVSITFEAGNSISSIVSFTKNYCLSGFEKFSGLPGTIGGAVYMNARCFDLSISDVLESVEYFDFESLRIRKYKFKAKDWGYKKSPFQRTSANLVFSESDAFSAKDEASSPQKSVPRPLNNSIILSATLRFQALPFTKANFQKIEDDCKHYVVERVSKGHFKFPSAGSVFKNNREFGKPSGQIIDEAGLRGYQIGGAQIAPFHGNFIINTGNATADDIKRLVDYTKQKVKERFGFDLEEEIIFVGN